MLLESFILRFWRAVCGAESSDMLRKIRNIFALSVNPSLLVRAAGDILLTYITHGNCIISLEENFEILWN